MSRAYLYLLPLTLLAADRSPAEGDWPPILENNVLRIALAPQDASLAVTDKRTGIAWRQQVRPGFRAENVRVTPTGLAATVKTKGESFALTISLNEQTPHAFDLSLDVPDQKYVTPPGYPFPFAAPEPKGWYYVQNTTGEGVLMPLDKPGDIQKGYAWGGGQPWWGLTDLKRAVSVRLDTFRNPDGRPGADDKTVFAVPIRINYAFFADGGYAGLAKEYRNFFLAAHPEMRPLRDRVQERPAVAGLKDSVYVYFWGKSPAEDLALATEMKAAGIDHAIAVCYGRHEVSRATFDGIKKMGWVAGMYRMPTGNLFQVSKNRGWPNALATGRLAPDTFYASTNPQSWDRICGKAQLLEWPPKAKEAIRDLGVQLFYFDTLVVQLAPCLHPEHRSTMAENQQARLDIIKATRDLGMVVGSGEGICPTWALPGVDFFEGQMSLRTYGDLPLSIPGGDYAKDFGADYAKQAAIALDETRRVPLYQLAFHDYVAGTWVWRDTNYQSTPFAWKKDLFNILYGTMPMWHVDRNLWEKHRRDFVASYKAINAVRERIGFAAMTAHGWLTDDRSVQFTDWDSGDRVVVNFGDRAFWRDGKPELAGRSYVVERAER
jgi:hypothetical protein